ncbi:MAG: hypothetical protein IPK44_16910 [Candidatus Accumulibacter sp.]|jgi:hypothetical protein|nr:hypothetical protein [Accumulibacter sp.]
MFLEINEHSPHMIRLAQIGQSFGKRVLVSELEQGRDLVLVEFFHPLPDILRKHEVNEGLVVELGGNSGLGRCRPLGARGKFGIEGDIGQNIEEIAVLDLDELLHLGQRLFAEPLVCEAYQ